jgi:hypothetical protein
MKTNLLTLLSASALLCLLANRTAAETAKLARDDLAPASRAAGSQSAENGRNGNKYFVDCSSSEAKRDGRSPATAWHALDEINAHAFTAGDALYLKRGTTCTGLLWPKGSGTASATIRLSAYGSGARPKVIANQGDEEAFRLFDQEYWDVDSIEFSGGTLFGVYVSGQAGVLHHIYLRNLLVHDVYGGDVKHKESGLVVVSPGKVEQHFDDVLVDGVTAYGTDQWAGILVGGGNFGDVEEKDWNTHVVVRNSTVHDLYGDGIILFRVKNGLIDSSAAWRIGMQKTQSIGTPNAIWTWMCQDCVVSNNEAFLTDSPGVDGGAFDIDYGNTRNSVIGNYGHDTQGYCIAVFAAGYVTHDSVVEGNLCINNGESPRLAQLQGAFFIWTWNNGIIDNLRVEKNAIYWNPPGDFPALVNRGEIQGAQRIFREDQIYSSSRSIIETKNNLIFADNRYTTCGSENAAWKFDSRAYSSFDEYRQGSGQEQGSSWKSEQTVIRCLGSEAGYQDKLAKNLRTGTAANAGVWTVVCELSASIDQNGLLDFAASAQLAVLKNLEKQFSDSGLAVKAKIAFASAADRDQVQNIIGDLGMRGVKPSAGGGFGRGPMIRLVAGDGSVVQEWRQFVGPGEIGLAVRRALGRPKYSRLSAGF